jgi:hypothetical protein
MINLFETRLIELLKLLEMGNKKQRRGIISLYNLNLRLLKLWNPKEIRTEI